MEKVVSHAFLKLSIFALSFCFGICGVIAQSNPLQKKISLSVKNESIENTLLKMGEQGNYIFSYNSDLIPVDSIVTINVVNKETVKILNGMLGTNYYYKTSGHYIIILKKNNTISGNSADKIKTTYIITGTIKNSLTGEKITTATVYNLNKIETALTDSAGSFEIKVTPESDYIGLGISKVNFYDTIIYIRPTDKNYIELKLSPKPETLNTLAPKTVSKISCRKIDDDIIFKTFVNNEMIVNSQNLTDYETRTMQISLIPYAGSNYTLTGSITNKVSLNILSGYSNGVNGVEVGGLLNINKKDVHGLQICGFGNLTGQNVNGVQIAGFFNTTMGKVHGVQIAGFCNTVFDTLDGVQAAGYVNLQRGPLNGVQLSGFTNITTSDVSKLQVTGYVNVALGNNNGGQISGFSNFSNGDNKGFQISGYTNLVTGNNDKLQLSSFANIALKESKGLQLSGFFNYAKTVKGSQIGIINIADTVSGFSFGILNIVRKGYHSLNFSVDEMMFGNLSYHMGTNKFYTIIGLSAKISNIDTTWGATFGFGTQLRANKKFYFNIDLTSTQINRNVIWERTTSTKNKFAVALNFKLSKHWTISAGPSLNVFVTESYNSDLRDYISDVVPLDVSNKSYGKTNYQTWIGYSFGIKFKF